MSLFPRVRSVLPAALACVALAAAAPPARDPGSGTSAGIRHRNDAVEATTQAPFGKEPVRREADEPVPHLKTHPGLEATLFAAEPMMLSPTNMDVDARGRVWVIEVVNYREHATNNERPEGDRILILEDKDGDGVADTSTVYYQGRDIDSALGIAVLGDQVVVTASPNVIVFTDEDGDDKPDRREYLFTKTGVPQHDHSAHAFVFGPDGRFYWNAGNTGYAVHDRNGDPVVDAAGHTVVARDAATRFPELGAEESPYHGGMVFRCDRDGTDFEVLAHNFRNNYEVTVDSFGTLWQSDNDDDGNAACRINYVMEFGNYGFRDELTGAGWAVPRIGQHPDVPSRHWHQNDPGVVPNLVHTGAGSPSGITVYEGRLLPEKFWDQVIHADAGPGVVWAAIATEDGAGYAAEMVPLIEEDRDKSVRPVDVAVAPDGSLFVADWYDPVVGWHRQYDLTRGRVYRIAPPGHVYDPPEHDFETPRGAVKALQNPSYAVRFLAWNALDEMQQGAEAALVELFGSSNPRHRARALWLLAKISGRGETYVQRAIRDADPDIRIVGLRAARQLKLDVIPIVGSLADDPSPRVRRECAIALRHHRSPEAAALWARLASQHEGEDRWYLEALGIGAAGQWDAYLAAWLRSAGSSWGSAAGRDILWRSRATVTPRYLSELAGRPDVSLDEVKRYLRAFDFQRAGEEKDAGLRRLVFENQHLESEKGAFVAAEALLRLDGFDLDTEDSSQRTVDRVLEGVAGTEAFAKLVRRYEIRERYPELMRLAVENSDNPAGAHAITTLLRAGEDALIDGALSAREDETAMNAADVLGRCGDARAVPLLRRAIRDSQRSFRVRQQAVQSLARTRDGQEALLEMRRSGGFPDELEDVAGAALTRTISVEIREEGARLFPMPALQGDETVPLVTDLLPRSGDPRRGEQVFEAVGCRECHVIDGAGTSFGPDLSRIGDKLSKVGLYESILDPSGGISPSYALYDLTLRDGREVSGFIVSETADAVTLHMQAGVVSDFARSEVLARRASPLSAMPSDLQRQMTVDDLVDLVEYMATLR